jgi:hypothetical protein
VLVVAILLLLMLHVANASREIRQFPWFRATVYIGRSFTDQNGLLNTLLIMQRFCARILGGCC